MHDVETFLTTFNRIERELKRRTGLAEHESFKTAAHRYLAAHRAWRPDFEAVMAFSDLRNVIVHDRFDRFAYLAVPSREVLDEIVAVHDRLLAPVRADQAFGREVVTVQAAEPLADVLRRIRDRTFTLFPAYDGDAFRGVVTAAGIAHWLAANVRDDDGTRVDFQARTVHDLLRFEDERRHWRFVARDLPASEVVEAFVSDPKLEAVLISEHGRSDQGLVGLATASDAAAWRRPQRPRS